MIKLKNLTILGTSHIAKQSISEIEQTITEQKPGLVCLELDKQRFSALNNQAKTRINFGMIRQIGVTAFFFALLGQYIQKKLAQKVGVKPGADMMHATKLAREHQIQVALIDRNITITLQRLSKKFSWKERFQIVKDIFRSIFFRKKVMQEIGFAQFDLSTVPSKEIIRKMIAKLRKDYPNLHSVLIEERNQVMARNLHGLMKHYKDTNIVAVVGAGHEDGMHEILKKLQDDEAQANNQSA